MCTLGWMGTVSIALHTFGFLLLLQHDFCDLHFLKSWLLRRAFLCAAGFIAACVTWIINTEGWSVLSVFYFTVIKAELKQQEGDFRHEDPIIILKYVPKGLLFKMHV